MANIPGFFLFLSRYYDLLPQKDVESEWGGVCRPEAVSGDKASTELKGFIQRAWHLLAGLLIRAHVLYAGQQLVQALPEEHLGPWALRRGAAAAVRPQPWTVCDGVHVKDFFLKCSSDVWCCVSSSSGGFFFRSAICPTSWLRSCHWLGFVLLWLD